MLAGFLTLIGCQLLGEFIQRALDLPLPGPVIGMLLLFLGLCIHGNVPKDLETGSQRLIELLPLLLMAPAAGVFFGRGFCRPVASVYRRCHPWYSEYTGVLRLTDSLFAQPE